MEETSNFPKGRGRMMLKCKERDLGSGIVY